MSIDAKSRVTKQEYQDLIPKACEVVFVSRIATFISMPMESQVATNSMIGSPGSVSMRPSPSSRMRHCASEGTSSGMRRESFTRADDEKTIQPCFQSLLRWTPRMPGRPLPQICQRDHELPSILGFDIQSRVVGGAVKSGFPEDLQTAVIRHAIAAEAQHFEPLVR
jgi:hypothetical protein